MVNQIHSYFCWKNERSFCSAVQKLLTFFQQKYCRISDINVLNINETLTNDIVRFEQPGPGVFPLQNDQDYENKI